VWRVEGQQWTVRDELFAQLLERVDAWGLTNARIQLPKKHQKYLPESSIQVPRPGDVANDRARDRVITDAREIAAFFG